MILDSRRPLGSRFLENHDICEEKRLLIERDNEQPRRKQWGIKLT
jgi:hypothetical protein